MKKQKTPLFVKKNLEKFIELAVDEKGTEED